MRGNGNLMYIEIELEHFPSGTSHTNTMQQPRKLVLANCLSKVIDYLIISRRVLSQGNALQQPVKRSMSTSIFRQSTLQYFHAIIATRSQTGVMTSLSSHAHMEASDELIPAGLFSDNYSTEIY